MRRARRVAGAFRESAHHRALEPRIADEATESDFSDFPAAAGDLARLADEAYEARFSDFGAGDISNSDVPPEVQQTILTGMQPGANLAEQAYARMNGELSDIEGQALATASGWASDAQQAIFSNLDPSGKGREFVNLGIQAAQDLSHGLNEQSFFAVSALIGTEFGGPVAGAMIAALPTLLQSAGQFIMSVFTSLGLAASSPRVDQFCGLIDQSRGQSPPAGPLDRGDGTFTNPGWYNSWSRIQSFIDSGAIRPVVAADINAQGFLVNDLGCLDCTGRLKVSCPPAPNRAAPFSIGYDSGKEHSLVCQYMQALYREQTQGIPTFETFYIPLWFRNADHDYNCSQALNMPLDEQALLQMAQRIWNAAHVSSRTRTVTRRPVAFGVPNDIVANTLQGSGVWFVGPGKDLQRIGSISGALGGQAEPAGQMTFYEGPALSTPSILLADKLLAQSTGGVKRGSESFLVSAQLVTPVGQPPSGGTAGAKGPLPATGKAQATTGGAPAPASATSPAGKLLVYGAVGAAAYTALFGTKWLAALGLKVR